MKVEFVNVDLNHQRLEAVLADAEEQTHLVRYRWHSKDATPLPERWLRELQSELATQRAKKDTFKPPWGDRR